MRAGCTVLFCLTVGCYSYRPVTTPDPPAGMWVAVTLTDAGTVELGPYLGADAFIVRGRYLSADNRGLRLSVTQVETKDGSWNPWSGEAVTIPTTHIAALEERQLAKGRTLLLAGVGVAGLAATAATFALIGGGTSPSGSAPPPGKK